MLTTARSEAAADVIGSKQQRGFHRDLVVQLPPTLCPASLIFPATANSTSKGITSRRGVQKTSNAPFKPTANLSGDSLTVEECQGRQRILPLGPGSPPQPRRTSSSPGAAAAVVFYRCVGFKALEQCGRNCLSPKQKRRACGGVSKYERATLGAHTFLDIEGFHEFEDKSKLIL